MVHREVISADQKAITAKTEAKAKAEQELTQAKSELAASPSPATRSIWTPLKEGETVGQTFFVAKPCKWRLQ